MAPISDIFNFWNSAYVQGWYIRALIFCQNSPYKNYTPIKNQLLKANITPG